MKYLAVAALALACSDQPTLTVQKVTSDATSCTFWICRGCVRRADEDFTCRGHEFLIQAYECPVEF
ncbi:MAG: hypothetical protein V4510_12370, partial [bacterium]